MVHAWGCKRSVTKLWLKKLEKTIWENIWENNIKMYFREVDCENVKLSVLSIGSCQMFVILVRVFGLCKKTLLTVQIVSLWRTTNCTISVVPLFKTEGLASHNISIWISY